MDGLRRSLRRVNRYKGIKMNMQFKLLTLVCLGVCAVQGQAQQVLSDADVQANLVNKELLQRGGKVSPRQQAELLRAEKAEQGVPNQKVSQAYLLSNKTKAGVVTLPNGVQYKVIKAGTGKLPTLNDAVRVRYQGALVDGSRFDAVEEKTPAALQVAGLLPGLQEALVRMPAGSKWEVVVPPELAYGARGYHAVGPNAVLIYVIELVGIVG
jgi:FKBP-type peptidyl-prolyl cis-trans isomerase FklB